MHPISHDVDLSIPVVVDLDGTLTPIDTLHEAIIRFLFLRHFIAFVRMFIWLLRGKAFFKSQMALTVSLDLSLLPWNEDVIEYIRAQKKIGRQIYLCTASNQLIANEVLRYFDVFDDAYGSDSKTNLSGVNKRDFLDRKFGKGHYEYVGNSTSDLPIWKNASLAVVKSNNKRLLSKVKDLDIRMRTLTTKVDFTEITVKQLRLHHWSKNILVLVPLFAAHEYSDVDKILPTIAAFLCFGLVASGTYILNDVVDIDADRRHSEKKFRPIAAGTLPIISGLTASFILLVGALSISFSISANFAYVVLGYLFYTTLYSLRLKLIIILDIISLSLLFTLRIIAGTEAGSFAISPWLLIFSFFIFLSLAAMKRYIELKNSNVPTEHNRRGYHVDDKLPLMFIGFASAYTSVAIFCLYLLSDVAQKHYSGTFPVLLSVPVLVYWLNHMWMNAIKLQLHHDPIIAALKDKTSLVTAFVFVAIFIASSLVS